MGVPERASHWDYFHLLGSAEDRRKFNYAVKLYVLFVNKSSDESTREYILTRVIQALGAVSNNMRAGAYSLFCTLLVNSPDMIEYETVKKIINAQLKPAVNMKADAEANVGQLLAYKALVQSKFLEKSPTLLGEVAENLMELSTRKSYLHGESLRLLGQITAATKQEFGTDGFVRHLKSLETATLDKLRYLMVLDQNIEESETLSYLFDGKRLLSPATAPEIGILLANCQNPSHSFYGEFFEAIAENHKYVSKLWKTYEAQIKDKFDTKKSVLETYYELLVDLLSRTQRKKQYKSFKVIVSTTAVESLLKHAKTTPDLTKKVCKCVSEALKEAGDSTLSLETLNKLVIHPGNFSFDEITGSRVVGTAWRTLDPPEAKTFAEICLEVVVKGEGVKNKDRLNALNTYCRLLERTSSKDDDNEADWRVGSLKTLLRAGLMDEGGISTELAAAIRKSCFNSLTIKFPSLPAYARALKELVQSLNSCLQKKLRIKVTQETKDTWDLSQKLISSLAKSLKKVDDDKKIVINALELVTCFIALKSIYEPKESQFNLTDLKLVLKRITSEEDQEGPEWIEVVLDLFLSMLSKENASNRKIVNIVFKSMVTHVNEGAFMQLVDVLRPGYDLKSAEDSKDGEEVEMEEDGSEDASSDDESETEEEEKEDADDDNEKENTDDDEESDDSDDMEDMDTSRKSFNMEKLQFDLRKALTPADSDNESINIDDLDEEQGRQLDATLSAIFKSAKVKKPKPSKETVTTHFRTRVLDLIETYCLAGMPLDHWLTLIPSILELANHLVATKSAGGLKLRLLAFLKRISQATISNIGAEDLDHSLLVQLLEQLVTRAASASGTEKDLGDHFAHLVKFCVRNTNHVHPTMESSMKKSMENFGTLAAESFLPDKSTLPRGIMQYLSTVNWLGVHSMMKTLVERSLTESTKPFKRMKTVELMSAYVNSDRLFTDISKSEAKSVKKLVSSTLDSLLELQTKGVFDVAFLQAVIGLITKLHDGKCSGFVDWKTWNDSIPGLLSVDPATFKKLKPQLSNLIVKLSLDPNAFVANNAKPMMKKSKPSGNQNQPGRKRKQVDARKLKKESKVRRLAAMDGLGDISWGKLKAEE